VTRTAFAEPETWLRGASLAEAQDRWLDLAHASAGQAEPFTGEAPVKARTVAAELALARIEDLGGLAAAW